MSISSLEAIFLRASKDNDYVEWLFDDKSAFAGMELNETELAKLRSLTRTQFYALTMATPEERILFFYSMPLDLINVVAFSNLYEHELMLSDSVRLKTYQEAIARHIKPTDVVIDLGTGSGILAFLTARNNAKHVYAIDHSDFIEVADAIAAHNKIINITFVKVNSRDFTPPEKVDIILHEQLGFALFNENMLQNLLDLKKRVLKKNGQILPGAFELYVEPITLHEEHRIPYISDMNIFGIDFSVLRGNKIIEKYKPLSYNSRLIQPSSIQTFLCTPRPILTFDLNKISEEEDLPKQINFTKEVVNSGRLDGMIIFFNAIFDNEIKFDTSPLSTYTSWDRCMIRLSSNENYAGGDKIIGSLDMQDITNVHSWKVSVS